MKRNQHVAYDEKFHYGVNVIRGDNSSGKSTVMNFIFYGLGGDLRDWSDIALLCTHVWLEVELNGIPALLKRKISNEEITAMEIYGGKYDDALAASNETWKRFPYRRSTATESFSQALFRLLEMPDVANELSGNVTMHQILRILYADQLSRIENIFRQESFDQAPLRETVGNLLCGAYDNEVYESQQLLKDKGKLFASVASELRSILTILGSEDEGIGVQWVEAKKTSFEQERQTQLKSLELAEESYYSKEKADKVTLTAQNAAYKKVQKLQTTLNDRRDEVRALEFDIADSAEFIIQIINKIESLRDAESVAQIISGIQFGSCPACFAEVLDEMDEVSACPLCKTPFDSDRAKERIVGLINEASIQLRQSRTLQQVREEKLAKAQAKESELEDNWKIAARELQTLQSIPTSKARQEIRKINRGLGYLDRQIEDLDSKLALAQKIEGLTQRKQAIAAEIEGLERKIDILKSRQETQLNAAHKQIEKETIKFLKNDLKRQDSFENPESVSFSFKDNKISVDEHSYFSASSRVILKCSFLLAFLNSALNNKSFRHPRFLMLDITDNNGMEVERSHNLQKQIMDISKRSSVKHQIIYGTAFPATDIAPELFIGEFSTRDKRTLRIQSGTTN